MALVRQLIFCNCVSTSSHDSILVADEFCALIFVIKGQTVMRAAKIATANFLYNIYRTNKIKIIIIESVDSISRDGLDMSIYITSIKNNCLMKSEVGMAVLKSKQTRVVGIISTYA